MCIAIPGKVVSIDGDYAQMDFKGNVVRVNIAMTRPNIGDFVLVHAGCAIEVLNTDAALEILEVFDEVENS